MSTPAPTRTGWAAPRGPFPLPPAPPRPDGLAAVYRRRDPTVTPLYPLVQHHFETFLAEAAAADPDGDGIPQWVEDDFRAYDAQLGVVSFLHHFGSALNPHFHFHVVVLDGVFSGGDDGSVTFHEATHLSADDVHRLERTLQRRVLRPFQRRALLDELTVEDMLTWQASGGSRRLRPPPRLRLRRQGAALTPGRDVTRFSVGDAVFAFGGAGMGCYVEYRAIPETGAVARKPANLSFEEAAAISFGGTTALSFSGGRASSRAIPS